MKNIQIKPFSFGALALGFSVSLLACGGGDDNDSNNNSATNDVVDPDADAMVADDMDDQTAAPSTAVSGGTPAVEANTPQAAEADCDSDPSLEGCSDEADEVEDVPPRDCTDQLITFDEIVGELQRDILRVDADDRVFTRYLLLTDRFNAGVCTEDLDRDRFGMNKILNMLSIESRVSEADALNADETIYRIDIRDFGWDRQVVVNGQAFDDGWEAIADFNDYALEFEGDEAEDLIAEAVTTVPWQSVSSLVSVASLGNLYYELIGVDVNATLDDFILNELGIDVVENFEQSELIRAGTTSSGLSRQDRVVERHDIEVRQGSFWQSFEFDANGADQTIFDDPFGFVEDERDAIFTLPNGFLAYIIADADGIILEESNVLPDASQDNFAAVTSLSCSGCHAAGFISVVDEVRTVVEANRIAFNADDFEAVQDLYVPASEFAAVVEADSQGVQRALAEAGIPVSVADPMSDVFNRFELDLDLQTVAADLGIGSEDLSNNIALLDPQLQIVRSTNLDRDDFTALYEASLCVMQGASQNQPVAATCDDAILALDD